MVEGRSKLVEGKEFNFPVDPEKGFFYYLENGMKSKQKEILAKTAKEFLKQVEQLKMTGKGEVSAPVGLKCMDENTREGVAIIYFRD